MDKILVLIWTWNSFFLLSDENTVINFTLEDSASEIFTIASNGSITTLKALDREANGFYAFQVRPYRL